mmetsp:Transcript_431/g.989  ORF Transcript_431/g.989 Transcript_431/m.989 type:complete len:142 (-) Transcript_431:701-1126(-)
MKVCSNQVKNRVCVRHGAKIKRCCSEGCTKRAQQGGVCITHDGAKHKLCSSVGCTNRVQEEECARSTGRIATIITNLLRLLLMKRLQLFLISALPQLQHSSTGDPLPSYRRSERQTYPNHDNIRLIFALPSMTLGRSCETH